MALKMIGTTVQCSFCKQETHRIGYIHREFGMSAMPASPRDIIWDFEYDGAPAFDKEQGYCMACYLGRKDDKQVEGWAMADKIVREHYTSVLNGDKGNMMRWLDGGALDRRRVK